jgi:VCBS repeat-containing protein
MGLRIRTICLLTFILLATLSFAGGLQFVYGAHPTTTTLSPTNVTATSATLRGSVNPNGKSTTVDFVSALPSGNPGYFPPVPSPPQNIGSGVVPVPVSYTLTNLHVLTEYRYYVRAINADGGNHGAVVVFYTVLPEGWEGLVGLTDWAVASVGIQPPSPRVGDAVTPWMKVMALSTNGEYPQNIAAQCTIDGTTCGAGVVTYSGPTGLSFTVNAATPWIATAGTHTLSWQVSTAKDPNPGNNYGSFSFSIAAPPPFDFDVAVSPSSLTSQAGQTQTTAVNVNLKSGTPQPVTLTVSGQPAGVTASLNPTTGTPTFTSTLTIVVSDTASLGTYSLSVTGSGGGQTHSSTIMLTVSEAADFRIDVNPASQSVAQGQTASYSVSVVGSAGFNSEVSLSVSGLPSGANGVFTVNSGTPDFSATLTVTLPSIAPAGSFTLVIKGAGGGLERTANAVLIITAVTTQTQTTQTGTTTAGGLVEMLQQNSLLIIAALIILVILFGAVAMRGRGGQAVPQAAPSRIFCGKCGTENPASNEFCADCGNKLKSS